MIRNFRLQDIDRVMELWLDTNICAHDFIEKSYWLSNFDVVKEMIPTSTIFVYENNGVVQGFMGLMDSYVAGIFVDNESPSKGIGKQLLDHGKNIYSRLSLRVYKNNDRAIHFYLREGFSIIDEQIDENTGEAEFVMNWTK